MAIPVTALGRRDLLGLGAAGALAGIARGSTGRRAAAGGVPRAGSARNYILLAADGMSTGTLTLGEMMRDVLGMGPSHWSRLWSRPGVRRAMCTTYAADSLVTDSAAAGSAWGCGVHVNNGSINITPDGREMEPILTTAARLGRGTGLVTTTRITHATPASFIANVPKRDLEKPVAEQMIDRGVDVLLGGGAKHFDLGSLASVEGLSVVRSREQLGGSSAHTGRLLGLFDEDHVRFALDRPAEQPGLAEMTRVALDRLARRPDGFVLQVEGGRIDHAAHDNDAAALVFDQIDFDEAIGVVAGWAADRDDTLVVVTTDHGNANPGLCRYGRAGIEGLERLARATRTTEWAYAEADRAGGGADALVAALNAAMAVELRPEHVDVLRRRIDREEAVDPFDDANALTSVVGSVLANFFGVSFMSPNHTADLVEVTAFGPGSESMPHLIDNVDLYGAAVFALGGTATPAWRG
jgi:alkaline phosphatase